jgi:hypothetical protein
MVHAIPAIGLAARPYFHRYSDDAIDLCDVLSSYSSQAKKSAFMNFAKSWHCRESPME